jgi:hypothetical protein
MNNQTQKLFIAVIGLLIFSNIAYAQNKETIIPIKDNRTLGISQSSNCHSPTPNHKNGDVEVEKTLMPYNKKGDHGDTTECYETHFYKLYGDELVDYTMRLFWNLDYDKVGYYWINDTTIIFSFINAKTNKRRTITLGQVEDKTGLRCVDDEDK